MKLLDKLLRSVIQNDHVVVTYYDGEKCIYGNDDARQKPPLEVRLTHKDAAFRIIRNPQLGAGEAYMDGHIVIEPPHDIRDLILLFMGGAAKGGRRTGPANRALRLVDHVLFRLDQIGSRARSSSNVRHHYDLTREFYELFLDEDRQYTMAYYRTPEETLECAQRNKKALIAAKLRLGPDMRVLDIGCGWGGLGLYLNRHYGCEVLGVSLAPDQVRFANERAAAAGVADKVRFELIDYRDVTGQFDRITSVGMIEHVGARNFGEYFAKTHDLLSNDGIMLTHTIGRTHGPGRTDPWTRKYIFPGGYIPALSELIPSIEQSGAQVADVETLRYHYALTLAEWYRRTVLHKDKIISLYDERMYRMWQFYLAGAEQTFSNDSMVNFHLQTVKRQGVLPMSRSYITEEAERLMAIDDVPVWRFS